MKRIVPLIFSIAIFVGIALPFSTTLSPEHGVRLTANSVFAAETYVPEANVHRYLEECGITQIPGCISRIVYVIPYQLGAWAMTVAAKAFDVSASLTLSSALYTKGDLLTKGWTVTRDFANIFFILILLFAALSLVLDMDLGGANPKKMLSSVVVIAILINFSFFLTEVVVDVSNSLALVFYNQIETVQKDKKTPVNTEKEEEQLKNHTLIKKVKPISETIVAGFKPQIFSNQDFYDKLACAKKNGLFTEANKDCTKDVDKKVSSGVIIPILILVGCMYLVVAYSFGVALISLIGRMISLFIAIIFAPFAFVSTILPATKHMAGFGWDEWFSNLMKAAFAAPIYFFLLLLVTFIVDIPIVPKNTTNMSAGIILVLVMIQCAIVITLILKATKIVESASGEIGGMILKGTKVIAGGAAGLVGGAALGGLALAGQGTLGFVGKKIAGNEKFNKWASGEGSGGKFTRAFKQFTGERLVKSGQFLGKSSFDARHTGVANAISGATGINLGSFGALAAKNTAGGLDALIHRKQEKAEKFANTLKYNLENERLIKEEQKKKKEATITQQFTTDEKEDLYKDAKEAAAEALAPLENDLAAKKAAYQAILDQEIDTTDAAQVAAKNAALTTQNGLVVAAQQAVTDQKSVNGGMIIAAEDEWKAEKKKLSAIKEGTKNANGTQKKLTSADYGTDATDAHGNYILDNNGNRVQVSKDNINRLNISYLGGDGLEKLLESNKKGATRAYLAHKAEDSGYHTHIDRDAIGNVTDYHVDSSKAGTRNWSRAILNVGSAALIGGLTGNIGALGTAIGGIGGAIGFGVAQAFREAGAEAFGGRVGSSYTSAEAMHHAAEPGGKHEHEHGVYHTPGSGFLAELASIFKFKAGGGGGGGHSGGGGGHH